MTKSVYTTHAKVRGRKSLLDRLFETVKEHLAKPLHNVAVCHGAALEEAQELLERIKSHGNVGEVLMSHVSPVIGVHTGPGTLGLLSIRRISTLGGIHVNGREGIVEIGGSTKATKYSFEFAAAQ